MGVLLKKTKFIQVGLYLAKVIGRLAFSVKLSHRYSHLPTRNIHLCQFKCYSSGWRRRGQPMTGQVREGGGGGRRTIPSPQSRRSSLEDR
jgi:hypothetical protein